MNSKPLFKGMNYQIRNTILILILWPFNSKFGISSFFHASHYNIVFCRKFLSLVYTICLETSKFQLLFQCLVDLRSKPACSSKSTKYSTNREHACSTSRQKTNLFLFCHQSPSLICGHQSPVRERIWNQQYV